MKILIVGNPFPNPKQVFIHSKILALGVRGHQIYNLSDGPINWKLFHELQSQHRPMLIRPVSIKETGVVKAIPILVRLILNGVSPVRLYREINGDSIKSKIRKLKSQLIFLDLSNKVDVIHFEWNNQAGYFSESLKYVRAPVIVSIRGRGITSQPFFDKILLDQLKEVFTCATFVHSISISLTKYLTPFSVAHNKIRIISPAVDLGVFIEEKIDYRSTRLKIATVAHLGWKKNIASAILIVSKLINDDNLDVEYDIIGEGNEREHLMFMIKELGLERNVFLLGHQSHEWIISNLHTYDVFLMPSIQEGFCNAVLEAQAIGLPSLVTNADGLDENVENEVTGIVVNRWNADEMHAGLRRLLTDKDLRVKMGTAAKERVKRLFNQEILVKKFEQLYHDAILVKT